MSSEKPRVVVVTGGNSGIGQAIAQAFAHDDARVIIIGRNEQTLRATAVTAIVEHSDHIDVLVNAAGFVRGITTSDPLDAAEQLWDEVLDTNLKGSFLMAMAAAPHLTRPGGRIINISSIAAFTGGSRPGAMAYAAAKAGLLGLTYGLARELSPQGITVNAIAPGFIADTGFTGEWPDDRVRGIVAQTPVGRAGGVDDIAAAALYLASPEASFITGEVLNVNGGWLFGH